MARDDGVPGRGGRRGKRFAAADQAVVVSALARGARVPETARLAGFSVKTLYRHRAANALFRSAWKAAVEESARPVLVAPGPGRRWQKRRTRRNRFTPERKEIFLEHFAATADATASADVAEIGIWAVYDHRRRDPAFSQGWDEALAQAYARLEAEAVAARLKAMETLKVRLGKQIAARDCEAAAEFERVMHLLREHKRGLAGHSRDGRLPVKWSFEAAFEALEKRLAAFGLRVDEEEEEGAPPPCSARSPSPRNRGEDKR